jgi:hypothetical protein
MVWSLCQYADDDDDSITFVFSILRNTTNQVSSSRWCTLKKSGRARGMNQMSRNSGSGSPSTKNTSKTTLSSHLMPPAARFARRDETANVFLVENGHPANGPQKRCRWQQNAVNSTTFSVMERLLATLVCPRICAKLTTLRTCSRSPLQMNVEPTMA